MTRFADPVFPVIFPEDQSNLRQFDRDLMSALGNWAMVVKAILDRGITIDDNVDSRVVSFTSNGTPDTEDAIAHTLGRVPTYFILADINKGGVVYRSATGWTKTNIYVKTTVAAAAVKLILL